MDSPRFTRLCFLLLTAAAPHPNIAMPTGDLAEQTQGSSFGKTYVTVYHCKDCESKMCKSSNYEDFVKIGETQSEKFSNEIIQLVTSETHIIMCFQQENTSAEGIYAIVWEKAVGVGDSCGILNSGGMLHWEPGYQHMENIFLVMKLNCYIFGQTVILNFPSVKREELASSPAYWFLGFVQQQQQHIVFDGAEIVEI
ncbi:unnamed protein product [Bubo scandiacus]